LTSQTKNDGYEEWFLDNFFRMLESSRAFREAYRRRKSELDKDYEVLLDEGTQTE